MDNFARFYYILWSVVAMGVGIRGLFFRKKTIKFMARSYMQLYRKTNFYPFKRMSEEFNKSYMDLLVQLLGFSGIVLGILLLLQNI